MSAAADPGRTPAQALARLGVPPPDRAPEPLHEGVSARLWRVRIGAQDGVLRVDRPLARRLELDRARELAALEHAAAAQLGPAVLAARPAEGLLLTRWVPGRAWTDAQLRQPANLARLARALHALHGLRARGPALDFAALAARYAACAGSAEAAAAAARARSLAVQLAALGPPAWCHGDALAANCIDDGRRLTLIDWEYAGLAPAAWDLGVIASHYGLDGVQRSALLGAYAGAADARSWAGAVELAAALYAELGRLWDAAVRASAPASPDGEV